MRSKVVVISFSWFALNDYEDLIMIISADWCAAMGNVWRGCGQLTVLRRGCCSGRRARFILLHC